MRPLAPRLSEINYEIIINSRRTAPLFRPPRKERLDEPAPEWRPKYTPNLKTQAKVNARLALKKLPPEMP